MTLRTVPLQGKKAAGRVAFVDDEDYELVSQYRWNVYQRSRRGQRDSGPYATTTINRRGAIPQYTVIRMHCLILGIKGVDHRNGNGLDNQRENLRAATSVQNAANQGPRAGTSRYKGVSWARRQRKWKAQIRTDGRARGLGYFISEEDAARAYDTAAVAAWGEYARLNFREST